MATMQCTIVSAEKEIFSEAVSMVVATGSLGEIGITPGHSQLLTGIIPGPVKVVRENGEEEIFSYPEDSLKFSLMLLRFYLMLL